MLRAESVLRVCVCVCGASDKGMGLGHKCCIVGCQLVDLGHRSTFHSIRAAKGCLTPYSAAPH